MFGERYFATRERLSEVVRGVRDLAEDTGTDWEPLADDSGLLADLHKPFTFLICGEVNAGKSSLANGLFGHELCESDAVPKTKEVQWFRYDKREHDEDLSEVLRHSYRDQEFLKDFSVVDTPGTNALNEESRAVIDELLPQIDLVFFVFPVTNAWGAATWNLISEWGAQLDGRIGLILQQKDLRGEEDMKVMIGHVQELAVQRLGMSPEVFPVSSLQAFEASQEEPVSELLWRESGFQNLADFISRKISQSPTRQQALRTVRDTASQTLRDIEERMEVRRRTLDGDKGFLSDIETEVDWERKQQAERLTEKFSGLGEVFGEQAEQASLWLAERVSVWQSLCSLFRKDETPAEIEKSLIKAVQEAVEKISVNDSDELVAACKGHWQTVIPRIEERLEMPPPDFEKESKGFEIARERFAKRLGGAARKAVIAQKLRSMLDHEMEAQRDSLRRSVSFALLAVIAAGVVGFLQWHLWAFVLLGLGALFLVIGLIRLRRSSQELVERLRERSSPCRRPFAEQLGLECEEGVRGFFVDYVSIFEGIRRHVADLSMKLKPQLEIWNNHFLELRAIDQDL